MPGRAQRRCSTVLDLDVKLPTFSSTLCDPLHYSACRFLEEVPAAKPKAKRVHKAKVKSVAKAKAKSVPKAKAKAKSVPKAKAKSVPKAKSKSVPKAKAKSVPKAKAKSNAAKKKMAKATEEGKKKKVLKMDYNNVYSRVYHARKKEGATKEQARLGKHLYTESPPNSWYMFQHHLWIGQAAADARAAAVAPKGTV